MTSTIGVKLIDWPATRYVISEKDFPLETWLVIQSGKGNQLGQVTRRLKEFKDTQLPKELPRVLRQANQIDIKAFVANKGLAESSKPQVRALIAQNHLNMKLIDIVFPLDRSYVLITFSAEERVDFRQLLKDLAILFKTRIELKQLNSREEAKVFGGIGPCGRPLCCSSFLGEFPTVSIKMLKNQSLSLNSGKNLGYCGRLLCCLQYEDDFYSESKKKFPDFGSIVMTDKGPARVLSINIFDESLKVILEDKQTILTYPLEEVTIGK
ncbi:regulatory iron-sulfur-containing complex subunit RicT [Streptococcus pseudoporcinus]|uniref:PSP1 C-terminal domain protein n=1 Tax=Streptococcus pseudoporcinus LQ 940-04 TaxID=875093 RepID=G5K8R9_9STRE|nr:regulatory iron-sulfur-containing complex subunit RicT [Streptococcus pseudoporcinus]EFR43511.1 PSP1 C-terminal domain protein [Streptococcus pseudoporcinus SPIN 20026]EHI64135.1 PSP1 C-terminal domain protein [Streptococcus pseudoporcinus LQ 940-04]VEF94366.1 stage 0 sporulation protein [Streptococcus pseudoporcinus]